MNVVEIDLTKHNFVVVGQHSQAPRYFVWRTCDNRQMLIDDACPHRQGPLHLGVVQCPSGALTCPSHGITWTQRSLERRSLPTVLCGTILTAVLPNDADAEISLRQTRIMANEHG